MTYLLVILHVISFVVGFEFIKIKNATQISLNKERLIRPIVIISNNIFFKIFVIILLAYVLSLLVRFFGIIAMSNGLDELRADFFDEDMNIYGDRFKPINQWILKPFSYICTLLFAVLCIYKRNLSCLLTGAYLFVYESLSGGRFGYVRITIIFIFVLFCLFALKKISKKYVFSILAGAFVIYELIMLVTVARVGDFENIKEVQKEGSEIMIETVALSFSQPMVCFDYALENDYLQRVGGYQFGTLTMTSLQRFVNPFFNKVGLGTKINTSKIDFKQKEYVDIGYKRHQNALYTSLLWYYLDFGVLGILFFPFLFGLLVRFVIKRLYQYMTVPILVILSILFYLSLFSIFDFWFTSESDLLMMVFLFMVGCSLKWRSTYKIYLGAYFFLAALFTLL